MHFWINFHFYFVYHQIDCPIGIRHALPMAIMSALPQFYSLPEVQSNATRVCRTTHNHSRVIQSAITLATMSALLLQVYLQY